MMASSKLLLVCLLCAPALTLAGRGDASFGPAPEKVGSQSFQASSAVALDEYGIPIKYLVTLTDTSISAKMGPQAANLSPQAVTANAKTASASIIDEILSSVSRTVFRASNGRSNYVEKFELPMGASLEISADLAAELERDPRVESVEVDGPVFLQGFADRGLLQTESTPYGIEMVKADKVEEADGDKKLCVIDSGLNTDHEEFEDAYAAGKLTGQEDANNWKVDECEHGTHCTGSIAARGGNGKGVTSVNPKGLLDLHIVQVFVGAGCGWTYQAGLLDAMIECKDAGAKIVSMSLGGGGASSTTEDWMNEQSDMLFFAAAGNGGSASKMYPASYDVDNLASIAAIDSNKNRASFSQYNDQVDLSGPGVGVLSTTSSTDGYASFSGTSMACPHVAGVAALVWNRHTECTAEQVMLALQITAEDLGETGRDDEYGHGLVDAEKADIVLGDDCGNGATKFPTMYVPPPTPVPTPGYEGEAVLKLSVTYDNYPGETSYLLVDAEGNVIEAADMPAGGSSGQTTNVYIGSLQSGSYTFTIKDGYGDGLCCSYGQGSYRVYTKDPQADFVLIKEGGEFALEDSVDFTIGASTMQPTPAPTSATAPTPDEAPSEGSCCEGHGDNGCEDNSCEALVCGQDSYCCDDIWDRKCVAQAEQLCGQTCTPSTCCEGQAITGCDDNSCENTVCALDPYCCDSYWDRECVKLAEENCGDVCD